MTTKKIIIGASVLLAIITTAWLAYFFFVPSVTITHELSTDKDDFDISSAPNGIIALPEIFPNSYHKIFTKYTNIIAPNGKPIHLVADSSWSDGKLIKARNILEYILTNVSGTKYGSDKTAVANSIADRKAALILFENWSAAKKGFRLIEREPLFGFVQNLHANEITVEGSEDYLQHQTRDAGFEEILHFVQDNGLNIALPEYKKELEALTKIAINRGFNNWAPDQTESNEYFAVLLDVYLDLWKTYPKIYEGKKYEITQGKTHFNAYSLATNREDLQKNDSEGFQAIEQFFPKYITYTASIEEDFEGAFLLVETPDHPYTHKSKYLKNIQLNGEKNADIIGNQLDNIFYGNQGDNIFNGGEGFDTVIYNKPFAGYHFTNLGNKKATVVGEGSDSLERIEKIKFSDKEIFLK